MRRQHNQQRYPCLFKPHTLHHPQHFLKHVLRHTRGQHFQYSRLICFRAHCPHSLYYYLCTFRGQRFGQGRSPGNDHVSTSCFILYHLEHLQHLLHSFAFALLR